MAKTIAKLRSKFSDLAAADLLDAQLALAERNYAAAARSFDPALRKDPKNKIAQFWRAQLDSRTGSVGQAVETLESIASSKTSKLLEPMLPLTAAADSALAAIEMESGRIDQAIQRIRALLGRHGAGGPMLARCAGSLSPRTMPRNSGRSAGKSWRSCSITPRSPPASTSGFEARHSSPPTASIDAADKQVELVFKRDPASAGAALAKARILSERKKPAPCPRIFARLHSEIEEARSRSLSDARGGGEPGRPESRGERPGAGRPGSGS